MERDKRKIFFGRKIINRPINQLMKKGKEIETIIMPFIYAPIKSRKIFIFLHVLETSILYLQEIPI